MLIVNCQLLIMDYLSRLSEYFKKFPGIGERQARRFVYFLLNTNQSYSDELIELIKKVKENTAQCQSCYCFFPTNQIRQLADCEICSNPQTDKSVLIIIEKDADLESIRSSGYKGAHFILGGLIPIMERNGENVRLKDLLKLVESRSSIDGPQKLKEIIIAVSLTPKGEHTDSYLRELLSPLQKKYSFKVSSLGRGISTGTELEYADADTIRNALKNRQ
jgi:recombination protein RecR